MVHVFIVWSLNRNNLRQTIKSDVNYYDNDMKVFTFYYRKCRLEVHWSVYLFTTRTRLFTYRCWWYQMPMIVWTFLLGYVAKGIAISIERENRNARVQGRKLRRRRRLWLRRRQRGSPHIRTATEIRSRVTDEPLWPRLKSVLSIYA